MSSINWWTLPGPGSFVSRVVADLRDGKNVVLCLPAHAPGGLRAAVRAALGDEDWPWHPFDVAADGTGARPEQTLFARFAPNAPADAIRNMHTLTREPGFAGKIVWLEGMPAESWPDWKAFLSTYQHACRSMPTFERTLFCTPLEGPLALDPPNEDVCLAQHHWRGAVDQLDIWLYTAALFAGRDMAPLHRRVAVAVAAHLALWDPAVSEALAAEPIESVLEPETLLRELGRGRGWYAGDAGEWHVGTADDFEGEPATHSALLALGDAEGEVTRRIWSAQVGVLLPYVEEQRRALISRLRGVLSVPHQTRFNGVIEDIRDLEIGHIEHQANANPAVDPDTRRLLWRLREIRNCLSHLEVLPPALLLCAEITRAAARNRDKP